eukprot:1312736-Amphidinium_carterae.2
MGHVPEYSATGCRVRGGNGVPWGFMGSNDRSTHSSSFGPGRSAQKCTCWGTYATSNGETRTECADCFVHAKPCITLSHMAA